MRSLFPSEHLTIAKVEKDELIETVKRVALVAERNTAVQLKFGDNQLVLDAGTGDEAQATEVIEAEITGDDLTTGFNPQFLLDGLTALDGEYIDLAFTQAEQAGRHLQHRRGRHRHVPLPADAASPPLLIPARTTPPAMRMVE